MNDPQTWQRRRPQLAPVMIPLLVLLVVGATMLALALWARTTVVILVRHAESGVSETGDPDLSPAGEARARVLGPFLEDALAGRGVDFLYATDLRRAQQTAASIANQFKVPINLLGSADWARLANRVRREHRGSTVAVVGGPQDLQGLSRRLLNVPLVLDEGDYSAILVVTVPSLGAPRALRLHYGTLPEAGPPSEKTTR